MLSSYLNQTAEHKPCTGTDDRGQPTYGVNVPVRCRRQSKAQNVLTATGQTVKTQHVYYTNSVVREGDMLDGKIVMGISQWTGLNGEIIGYRAVV